MGKPLRVLIVEDSEDDALLVIRELERGGYDTTFERVETAEAMTAALEKQAWDIIIADYHLPHFSAPEALQLLHQSRLDLPFIVISGTVGEETAVATMKDGAHDYLMKDNLTRLVPAIERELHEAEVRQERKLMQEELRIAEQNFRNSLDNSPLGIRIVATEGELLYANQAILDIYGYSSFEELKATPAKKRYTPKSYAEHQERKEKRKLGKPVPSSYEISLVRKDGEIRQLVVSRKAVVWGGEVQFQIVYQDITDRKQAEEALRQSEEKLETILENTSDIIFQLSPLGTIQYVSPRAIELYGYKAEDLIGRHLRTTTPARELPKALKVLKSVLSGKGISNFEINQLDANERIVPVEINATPVRKDGKIIALQGVMRDITQRKEAQDRIKRAAEEWRTTFDSITDLVSIHDEDFRLFRVNKAFADVLKMKPKELVGRTCYQVLHGTNEPVPSCPHKVTLETKKPHMAEFFEPRLGIHLEVATSPVFNKKGEAVASVHVARDITERKKMEEQLIVTDRLASIGELASGIAHELNNPLTSVIGFSDLLLSKDVPDDVKEDLEVISREAKRTADVVRNLLTFARNHPEEKQTMDINKAIQTVLELRAYEQRVNNIEVNVHIAPDLPEIMGNSFQLQQVFLNIIINAEHFMLEAHDRGTLTVTTERVGSNVQASFVDDGPGIAKDNLRHLFDPFFTTKEVGKGTGLGLSICHGIIAEHGGRIYTESELGKGATFIVELPISK